MDFRESCALNILGQIRKISRFMDVYSREIMKRCGLTVTQLMILRECRQNNHITVGILAKILNLSSATISEVINRLVNKGLLTRAGDVKDRRKIYLIISEAGLEILENAPPALQEKFYTGISELEDTELNEIHETLQKILSLMGEEKLPKENLGRL